MYLPIQIVTSYKRNIFKLNFNHFKYFKYYLTKKYMLGIFF